MKVAALLPFSLLDYPGKISAVIFTQGCPLRCVYCHNPDFQNFAAPGKLDFSDVIDFLKKRIGLLDGVVFSGGEPLLQSDLYDAMEEAKSMGFLIGLHTSGAIYNNFINILKLTDWIGFDFKMPFSSYDTITQVKNLEIEKSFEALINSAVDYEIRTTVDSRFITRERLMEMAHFLVRHKVKEWILQECILRGERDIHLALPSEEEIQELSKILPVSIRS